MDFNKIVIIGGSIWGNRGAAAMLETTIGKILEIYPHTEFSIFTPYPKTDNNLLQSKVFSFYDSKPQALIILNLEAIWFWLLKKIGINANPSAALNAIIESRLLLDIGGITFADGRLLYLPYNILTILPALLLSIPVIKLSQAAGSFHNPIIRTFAKIFLKKCKFIFARGEKTFAYLLGLGLEEKQISLAMDATFVYEEKYCLTTENVLAVKEICSIIESVKAQGKKIIGISPSILVMDKMETKNRDYISTLINVIKKTSPTRDVIFLVFPNASREGSKKRRNNDIFVIEEFQNQAELELPLSIYKQIIWMPYDIDTKRISELVSRMDLLITSRFHAMVFGLRLGIPTIVIGWSHKYLEVMKFFNQERFVFDYRASNQNLSETVFHVLQDEKNIRSEIDKNLPLVKALSQKQFDYLEGYFN